MRSTDQMVPPPLTENKESELVQNQDHEINLMTPEPLVPDAKSVGTHYDGSGDMVVQVLNQQPFRPNEDILQPFPTNAKPSLCERVRDLLLEAEYEV